MKRHFVSELDHVIAAKLDSIVLFWDGHDAGLEAISAGGADIT